jgi:hypothetical protein
MPELDSLKEELAYLRLWLGMLAVTDISLIGWTASAVEKASERLLSLSIVVTIVLGLGILLLHRTIERGIARLRNLPRWT